MLPSLIFLDFDGVICDSLPECYLTSRLAWEKLNGRACDPAKAYNTVPDTDHEKTFRLLRPFIRDGGDYLLLQHALSQGKALTSQKNFDQFAESHKAFHKASLTLFQECRAELLDYDRSRWFNLNPLFDGIPSLLSLAGHGAGFILSTKPEHFIREILHHHGITWQADRIICSGKRPKVDIITELLEKGESTRAYFVDDQIDHLLYPHDERITCLLASWGYIFPQWLEEGSVPAVSLSQLELLIRKADKSV
ncbi:HAD family hydrolase [Sediminispirochaeta bajacaliforniensis]|uniref:HAD family hydrolase n=1 Tax=Sediminispirochaeta bajacaliforniensis TaxID=148 RepID=UPI0003673426|nr:HAD family hydrolase [Sediminispirochaeta bajacaliforniensis]